MSRKEYLDRLRECLSYELPGRMVESNIRYYENYFEEQMRLGKSFQEIEQELGDPQLIARTCIDAAKSGADGIPNSGDDPDFTEEIERESSKQNRTGTQDSADGQNGNRGFRVYTGSGCLIPILIAVAILICLIAFLATPFGLTVLIGMIVAGIISSLIRRFRK